MAVYLVHPVVYVSVSHLLVISKTLEFRLVRERWSDNLLNSSSQTYIELKDKIMKGVSQCQMILLFIGLNILFELY